MLYKPMPYKRLFTVIKSIIAIKLVQKNYPLSDSSLSC